MMKALFKKYSGLNFPLGIILLCVLAACVEPYAPKTDTFESVLIVDATLTDELKTQKIVISETYRLEERIDTVNFVNNASVSISSSSGETVDFVSVGNGEYKSTLPFQAIVGETYELEIRANNETYISTPEKISGPSQLDDLFVERAIGNNGLPGAAILVNNNSDGSNFYRYTYEETYKIVSPFVPYQDLIINEDDELEIVLRTADTEICYNTLDSEELIVADTEGFSNNSYTDFLVKFLNFRNEKVFHRYSILVNQLNISAEAYNYFQTSNELAGNDNVFSQKQPGYLQGNLTSVDNENRKIVGYFSVASVDSKRIFFDYTDIFDIEERPDLLRNCERSRPSSDDVYELIRDNQVNFLFRTPGQPDQYGGGPYMVVSAYCVDCTVFGTTTKPEFWID